MLYVAIPMFLVAAVFGLTMAIYIFKNRFPPFFLIVAHGFFGLQALMLAMWVVATPGTPSVVVYGVVVVLLGALGGVFLISFQFRDEKQPKVLVVLHALAAVSGVSCLLLGLLQISRYSRPMWLTWVGH
ncbi:MAG TPA: hypothetical protein VH183_11615 [Burkholderiaceae bacterium]|jgi:hypothetical protein|nr:hypothetical protein [Burkholderiaceae bacterium]